MNPHLLQIGDIVRDLDSGDEYTVEMVYVSGAVLAGPWVIALGDYEIVPERKNIPA